MISNRLNKWYAGMVNKAAHLGQLGDVPTYKIGAILVHRKSIIGTGFNKRKTHPMQKTLNQNRTEGKRDRSFIHAEIDCIAPLHEVPEGSTLFVGRFDMNGCSGMCRPCEACMMGIRLRGIREVVYNTPSGFAIEHLD